MQATICHTSSGHADLDRQRRAFFPLRHIARPAVLALLLAMLLGGCAPYQLRGKAVQGATSAVLVVDQDDPRLEEPGLAGAVVTLRLNPDRLSAKTVGADVSDVEGDFAIAVEELGAGFLEYDAMVVARLSGHAPAVDMFQIPSSSKRLLVILAPGEDRPVSGTDDFLHETLEMGKPYMD